MDFFLFGALHHDGLLLLEPLADPLAAGHELLDAAVHAARLARHERFGGEVIDAGIEAVGDEVREHLWREGLSACNPKGIKLAWWSSFLRARREAVETRLPLYSERPTCGGGVFEAHGQNILPVPAGTLFTQEPNLRP